jgi:hypothetical protein
LAWHPSPIPNSPGTNMTSLRKSDLNPPKPPQFRISRGPEFCVTPRVP